MAGEESRGVKTLSPSGLAPPGGHYSHMAIANGLIFISGLLPITPDGTRLVDASFEEQVDQALANLKTALHAAGSDIDQLVQVRVYVDSIDNWPAFNTIYAAWAGSARPARAVVPTGPLHFGLKVEIEGVALASASI